MRETADAWRTLDGGISTGWTSLNKLQVAATWRAEALGDPGLRLHLQLFRTNGERLTSRTGDLQTISNIEALSATRLFEAFAEQQFGQAGHGGLNLRAGLVDLNSDFDSIDPAALFIDSSHGIGPDLSKSGRNGPSIFPVSAAAVRLAWTPAPDWTVKAGLFDGVPGDPDHPRAFAAVKLGGGDGTLAIAQLDRKLGKDGQVSLGAWRYSAPLPALAGTGLARDQGVYGFLAGALPGADGWRGWLRLGRAAPDAQLVASYVGVGVVRNGPFADRPDDQAGLAISRAGLANDARRLQGLAHAETTLEATYQVKVTRWLSLQPDVQYVVHPSSRPGLPNALAAGLRVLVTGAYPKPPASAQDDPTTAPDTPPPPASGAPGPSGA